MAISILFAGANIVRPGSYSSTSIADGGTASPAVGVLALIGEANEGIPFASETGLNAVTFGPDELQAITDKYGSGELVDMAKLAISPSNDPQIQGGAQELILIKTNASTNASLVIKQSTNPYGTVSDPSGGVDGNGITIGIAVATNQATITVSDTVNGNTVVSAPLGNNPAITLSCNDGTASVATATITATTLSTTITGGTTAHPLSIPLAQYTTLAALVAYINAQGGYVATVAGSTASQTGLLPPSVLDTITAQDIKTAPYSVKKDAYEVAQFFANGQSIVNFTPTLTAGLPSTLATTYLSGGALGGTNMASIQAGLDALLKRRVNYIVPCFSRDATSDITAGVTDPTSTYTIASIYAAVVSHCNQASTVKGRKERRGAIGFKDSFANSQAASANINSARVSLMIQDVDVSTANGVVLKQPHALAVAGMAMKCSAPFGLSNTFKSPAIFGFSHVDFDPETMAEQAINANITFVENAPGGGFRFELDNSTYASQTNAWVYNRPSVLDAADLCAYIIRINTEVFVGQRNSDINEPAVENKLTSIFDSLRSAGLIVGDAASGGKGYKDLQVTIAGSIITINVTLVLVENYEFILNNLKVQRAA